MKIHHISMLCSDAQQNYDFYTKIIGLRLVKNTVNQENPTIQHLFYGDYTATPGSVLTFFAVPFLGTRTDGNHYINGATLAIPSGTIDWWENWLTSRNVLVTKADNRLTFEDSDHFKLTLFETENHLSNEQKNAGSPIPADKQIINILGTEWHVPDLEESVAFFSNWLGLSTNDQNQVELEDGQFIELFEQPDPNERTRFGKGSTDHLALQSPDEDHLLLDWEKAKDLGYDLEMFRDRFWFKSIYVKDPGDNRLELATMGPGFTRDEPLDQLGKTVSLPPWLEPKRAEIEAKIVTF